LDQYGVKNELGQDASAEVLEKLKEKSQGLPLYCEELAVHLKAVKRSFSEDALEEFPIGMADLTLHVFEKLWPEAERGSVLPLISLLAQTGRAFSDDFLDLAFDMSAGNHQGRESRRSWDMLKAYYTILTARIDGSACRSLGSHWAHSFSGLARSEISAERRYLHTHQEIIRQWRTLAEYCDQLAGTVSARLQGGLRHKSDALLCVDLAKLGDKYADQALGLWGRGEVLGEFSEGSQGIIKEDFYDTLAALGFRARDQGQRNISNIEHYFDAAFSILPDPKDMMQYIGLLRRYGLREASSKEAYEDYKKKTAGVFDNLVKYDPRDKISLSYRADFWEEVGDYEKAEEDFRTAIGIESQDAVKNLSTIHAYAVFLQRRGDVLWETNPKEGDAKFDEAKNLFSEGIGKLDKELLEPDVKKKLKTMFFNAYASALINEATKQLDMRRTVDLDSQAVDLLEKALKIDPDDSASVNVLATVLIKYGWILPEYEHNRIGAALRAKDLLEKAIDRRGGSPDPRTLHILGRLLYLPTILPPSLRSFESAKHYLEESADKGGGFQRAVANHELGKLFMCWAHEEPNRAEPLLKAARERLDVAASVPSTPSFHYHLAGLAASFVRLSYLCGKPDEAAAWLDKMAAIATSTRKTGRFVPEPMGSLLVEIGDELLADGDARTAKAVFQEACERGDKSSYARTRVANCCRLLGEATQCLLEYRQAVSIATRSSEFGGIREGLNATKQELYASLSREQLKECQRMMLECSQRAYAQRPTF